MSELKPCPFCGGEAILGTWRDEYRRLNPSAVHCSVCHVETKIYERKKPSMHGTGEPRMINEIWKPIGGYDYPYKVSNLGRVMGKYGVLKPYDNGYGYLVVDFRKGGKRKHLRVHRLVAEAFVSNSDNLPEVNHKDENKHNNVATNLEWCTSSYNKCFGSGREARSEGMKKIWNARRASE